MVLLVAQEAGHPGRLVKRSLGVRHRLQRSLVDLVEMRFSRLQFRRRNVEGHGVRAEREGVEPRVDAVDLALERLAERGEFRQLRHGRPIHDLHAVILRVQILVGQNGIADQPVEIGALRGAGTPLDGPPVASHAGGGVILAIAQVRPAGGSIVGVTLPVGQRDDLLGGAGNIDGGSGELALVEVVDLDGLAEDGHGLRAGRPREVRALQQAGVALERGEVVAVGVAVALGEHALGVGRIDFAVAGGAARFFADVVIGGVERFARVDAAGEVPVEAVVGGRDRNAGREKIVATAQEGELLVEHTLHLAFEGEARGVDLGAGGAAIDRDGGVGRVGVGLIAEEGVEVVQVTGREQEGVVGRRIVVPGIDADGLSAVEHRLVDFDQSEAVDIGEAEGDVALPAFSGLGQQRHIGVHRIVVQVGDALVEGIDPGQHPLDPSFDQLRGHPARPGHCCLAGSRR